MGLHECKTDVKIERLDLADKHYYRGILDLTLNGDLNRRKTAIMGLLLL